MLTNDQRYIIRELKSYNYLHLKLAEMTDAYVKTLAKIDNDILAIDYQLNENGVKAIRYDQSQTSKPRENTRVVELIYAHDNLMKRKEEIIDAQKKEVNKIAQRIDDMDVLLNKLSNWERQFITHMYVESRCIEYMMDSYKFKSKTSVYNTATRLLEKMLKK